LGLSTVYGIVHQFGGNIYVDTRLAAGTSFQLYFPVLAAPNITRQDVNKSTATESAGQFTILLADDEPAIRQAIAEYRRNAGHLVLDSHSSLEALEIARHHKERIDIVLTDVVMPGLRGTELAEQVTELHNGICVIYMAG
jgi:two-component system, cell cycle sensor histidine kinase and response regulator CckA